jgi:hypothetical protein
MAKMESAQERSMETGYRMSQIIQRLEVNEREVLFDLLDQDIKERAGHRRRPLREAVEIVGGIFCCIDEEFVMFTFPGSEKIYTFPLIKALAEPQSLTKAVVKAKAAKAGR